MIGKRDWEDKAIIIAEEMAQIQAGESLVVGQFETRNLYE
jgi:hypothetical protein